ncbi:hypothetical protein D3C75_884010 [compost metagenome]
MLASGNASSARCAALASVLMPSSAAVVCLPPMVMLPSVSVASVELLSLPLSDIGMPGPPRGAVVPSFASQPFILPPAPPLMLPELAE